MAERNNRPDHSDDDYAPKQRESGDPLAELARLIGQGDPFGDLGRQAPRKPLGEVRAADRPAPEWLARPPVPQDQYDDPQPAPSYRAAQHDDNAGLAHEDRYAPSHDAVGQDSHDRHQAADADHDAQEYRADDRYRVALPPPQDYEDSDYDEDGHMPPRGEDSYAPSRSRGGLVTIAAVLGLALVGTAGAFGYRAFTNGTSATSNPPVIKADPTPAKIVPPTTTASADSKPFQDRIGAPEPERIVPREEQPVSLPTTPQRAAAVPPQAAFAPAGSAPLVAPPPPAATNEPKRVRTVTIRPDGATTDAAPLVQSPTGRAPASKQSSTAPLGIAPQPDPASRTKAAARTPPAQAAGGAYVVQVSAQKTEDEARSSYQALQQKYPAVLGGRDANIRRADLGDKGVYFRAQVGPFATAEQANTFCGNLKTAGGQCIVQKN